MSSIYFQPGVISNKYGLKENKTITFNKTNFRKIYETISYPSEEIHESECKISNNTIQHGDNEYVAIIHHRSDKNKPTILLEAELVYKIIKNDNCFCDESIKQKDNEKRVRMIEKSIKQFIQYNKKLIVKANYKYGIIKTDEIIKLLLNNDDKNETTSKPLSICFNNIRKTLSIYSDKERRDIIISAINASKTSLTINQIIETLHKTKNIKIDQLKLISLIKSIYGENNIFFHSAECQSDNVWTSIIKSVNAMTPTSFTNLLFDDHKFNDKDNKMMNTEFIIYSNIIKQIENNKYVVPCNDNTAYFVHKYILNKLLTKQQQQILIENNKLYKVDKDDEYMMVQMLGIGKNQETVISHPDVININMNRLKIQQQKVQNQIDEYYKKCKLYMVEYTATNTKNSNDIDTNIDILNEFNKIKSDSSSPSPSTAAPLSVLTKQPRQFQKCSDLDAAKKKRAEHQKEERNKSREKHFVNCRRKILVNNS